MELNLRWMMLTILSISFGEMGLVLLCSRSRFITWVVNSLHAWDGKKSKRNPRMGRSFGGVEDTGQRQRGCGRRCEWRPRWLGLFRAGSQQERAGAQGREKFLWSLTLGKAGADFFALRGIMDGAGAGEALGFM